MLTLSYLRKHTVDSLVAEFLVNSLNYLQQPQTLLEGSSLQLYTVRKLMQLQLHKLRI